MYPVSNEYMTALRSPARFEHCRGTIGGDVSFTDANIINLNYSNRCSDTADVNFGSAYIGQIDATFINLPIARGSWRDLQIIIEAGLTLEDDTIEYIPLGVFTVQSAEWTDVGIRIIANDNMIKLDRTLTATQITGGTIYTLAHYACEQCGLTFGLSEAQAEALPNGTEILGLYSENDIKTYRDFLAWIAQVAGGFVTADREGNIIIRSFADNTVVDTLTAADRISGSTFADYATLYDGISIVNIEDQTLEYYSAGTGDGAAINLGSNPFLQYGLPEVKKTQRERIAAIAHGIAYTPFKTSVLSNIVYDLGDVIQCAGGIAGATIQKCCIMQLDWTLKQTTALAGFGADPSLATGQSKTDKNLAGLLSKTQNNTFTYYSFANIAQIGLPESTEEEPVETTIINIKFAAKEAVPVELWHEINLYLTLHDGAEVDVYGPDPEPDPEDPEPGEIVVGHFTGPKPPARVKVRYYLDNTLIDYTPEETWDEEGLHILGTNYFLPVVDNTQTHTWRVTLEMLNGSATINIDNAHALLKGQGLVGEDAIWDGEINIEDTTGFYAFGHMSVADFTDAATIELQNENVLNATDVITPPPFAGMNLIGVQNETVSIILENIVFDILTEEGDTILTEDEMYNLTTED